MFVVLVVAVSAAVLVAGAALVVLTFVTTRAVVRGRRKGAAAVGLAVLLTVAAAGLALTFGGATAYPDMACARHRPPGFEEGSSWTQGAGLWPPSLRCRFENPRGQVATYQAGFDVVWAALAFTAVFAAGMGVLVASAPYARRRLGLAPISSDVGPSDR